MNQVSISARGIAIVKQNKDTDNSPPDSASWKNIHFVI